MQEELEQERQALADLRADGDGYDGWTSDPEEEEMFRREAEEQEARQSQAEVRQDTSSKRDASGVQHTADAGVGERGAGECGDDFRDGGEDAYDGGGVISSFIDSVSVD
jgi:hypothetical protein